MPNPSLIAAEMDDTELDRLTGEACLRHPVAPPSFEPLTTNVVGFKEAEASEVDRIAKDYVDAQCELDIQDHKIKELTEQLAVARLERDVALTKARVWENVARLGERLLPLVSHPIFYRGWDTRKHRNEFERVRAFFQEALRVVNSEAAKTNG